MRVFAFGFAPRGWAFCNGQTMPINQNQALFSLLGTTFGGNGTSLFSSWKLSSSCIPIHQDGGASGSFDLGQKLGEATHTLSLAEYPSHTHTVQGRSGSRRDCACGCRVRERRHLRRRSADRCARRRSDRSDLRGGQPHENMQPYTVLNIGIALQGIFPEPELLTHEPTFRRRDLIFVGFNRRKGGRCATVPS